MHHFESIPELQTYLHSETYKSTPIFPSFFNTKKDTGFTLGYWGGFKGVAEPVRLLAEYTGLKYHEKNYFFDKKEEWFAGDKQTLGFDFPNLPYIIDGSEKLTESDTLLTYIVQKSGRKDLLGKDEKTAVKLVTLKGVLADLQKDFRSLHGPDFAKNQDQVFNDKIFPRLDNLSKFLGDKKFFVGDITVFDFVFYQSFHALLLADSSLLDKYPNFKALLHHIDSLPELQTYLKSERNQVPLFPPFLTIPQKHPKH